MFSSLGSRNDGKVCMRVLADLLNYAKSGDDDFIRVELNNIQSIQSVIRIKTIAIFY
jgi:hypothetical protein